MSLPRITDYDILEKLGVGSYASVYKVRHKVSYKHLFCFSFANYPKLVFDI